jgi:hypothetical protein
MVTGLPSLSWNTRSSGGQVARLSVVWSQPRPAVAALACKASAKAGFTAANAAMILV